MRIEAVEAYRTTWETPVLSYETGNLVVIEQVRRRHEPYVQEPTCYIAEMTVTPQPGHNRYEFWWYFYYPGTKLGEGWGSTRVMPRPIPVLTPLMIGVLSVLMAAFALRALRV